MGAAAKRDEDATALAVVDVAVLALEILEDLLLRQRAAGRELPHAGERPLRVRELRRVVPRRHVAERGPEDRVVARRDQVQRAAHHRRLHHRTTQHGALERLAPEVDEA
jgi:hypothetical protein